MNHHRSAPRTLVLAIIFLLAPTTLLAETLRRTSIASEDGYVTEGPAGSGGGRFVHSSGRGGSGLLLGDGRFDEQHKAILSFDTSGLPTGAVVDSVTLTLVEGERIGNPFLGLGEVGLDLMRGSFGWNPELEATDFQAEAGVSTHETGVTRPYGADAVHSVDLSSLGAQFNDAGQTQLRLDFSRATDGDGRADSIGFHASDSFHKARRPFLEIGFRDGGRIPGFIPPSFISSPYEVPIDLPACDDSAYLIETVEDLLDADWDDHHTTYCVKPGDYSDAGKLNIKGVSGDAHTPKVLRYFDPSDDAPSHPVERADTSGREAVIEGFFVRNSNFWIFDGLTVRGSLGDNEVKDASDNVFNRVLIEDAEESAISFNRDSDRNIIQNSVIRDSDGGLGSDQICIKLDTQQRELEHIEIEGTRIVNNELINCNDGIHASKDQPGDEDGDEPGSLRQALYPGTIIDNNDIYITDKLYTRCDGEMDRDDDRPVGACACAENAIDLKGTVSVEDIDDPTKWVHISNNRMWGFRPTDDLICGSGSHGSAVALHRDARAVQMHGNVIWNSSRGVMAGGAEDDESGRTQHTIENNLFYAIHRCDESRGEYEGESEPDCAMDDDDLGIAIGTNTDSWFNEIHGNTIIRAGKKWFSTYNTGNDLSCNVAIESGGATYSSHDTHSSLWNAFYDTPEFCPDVMAPCDSIGAPSAGAAEHADWSFHVRRWTGPEVVTIPDVLRSRDTPELPPGASCGAAASIHSD